MRCRERECVCVEWKLKENKQTTDRQEADKRQAEMRQAERDRHHRWRIRLASGSKQAARATPTARSACFVPQRAADQDFTQQRPFTVVPERERHPKPCISIT